METQNFKNHSKLVTGFHKILLPLLLLTFIGSIVNLVNSTCQNVYSASLISLLTLLVCVLSYYARAFALKAQDRAIRAEENFRHFAMTGKPLDSRLRMGQIIALRFASDAEYLTLIQKTIDENCDAKTIKQNIKDWKGDYNRA